MRAGAPRRRPAGTATWSARAASRCSIACSRLTVAPPTTGRGAHYMVHRPSGGATEMATDLPGLWLAVEGLVGHAPDPLDPALVAQLENTSPAGPKPPRRQA